MHVTFEHEQRLGEDAFHVTPGKYETGEEEKDDTRVNARQLYIPKL
jgi:hypothetical protein